jgi:hypothetical protein
VFRFGKRFRNTNMRIYQKISMNLLDVQKDELYLKLVQKMFGFNVIAVEVWRKEILEIDILNE